MESILTKKYFYHTLIWVLLWLAFVFIMLSSGTEASFFTLLLQAATIFIPVIIGVYSNYFLLYYFFHKRKYVLYILSFLILVLCTAGLSYLLSKRLEVFEAAFSQEIINISSLLLFSVGIRYLKRGIISQFQLQELKAKTKDAELNALKAQINPHFLFNTLNNIYSVNQFDSEKGSEMIMELSDVMRYHLKSSTEDKVTLQDEVQLLKSYIALEKLRLTVNCTLTVEIDTFSEKLKIAPLLLLPFAENAFKHGTHPTKKSFINIKASMVEKNFHFSIMNSVIFNKSVVKTNIGLQNTKRRLQLIYKDNFNLDIYETETVFTVLLKIKL